MIFCCLVAMLWSSAWGVGEVVFVDLPPLIKCGEPVQLNWTYVGNASSVFEGASSELYITAAAMSVSINVKFMSFYNPRYPSTSAVVVFNAPRVLPTIDVSLGLYGQRLTVGRERTGSTQPNAFKTQFACCPDCCLPAPNECGHVNATFQCAGRLCAPAGCPKPSAAPGLRGCLCSTNTSLLVYQRCGGDYACDSPLEYGYCSVAQNPKNDLCSPMLVPTPDSCWQRNTSFACVQLPLGDYCRECVPGNGNCRCDARRDCAIGICADERCASLGCRGCPCGRWRTCATGLVCNDNQVCETAPANATELCKSASDSAAQQCDYATQQSDIDELMRSAPQDEALPVLLTAAVAPMCAKLRQLLMCRARVFDGSNCVDTGIGGTVKRLCEAIRGSRLAALNCALCEPEPCGTAKPACLRGFVCIDSKCVVDPQFAICRNAAPQVDTACRDPANQQDIATVQVAAMLGSATAVVNATCARLLEARTAHGLCYARKYAEAGCKLPQSAPGSFACRKNGVSEGLTAIGCTLCEKLPLSTSSPTVPDETSGPVAPGGSTVLSSADINTGRWLAPVLGIPLTIATLRTI
jgi:hypothetical protein